MLELAFRLPVCHALKLILSAQCHYTSSADVVRTADIVDFFDQSHR